MGCRRRVRRSGLLGIQGNRGPQLANALRRVGAIAEQRQVVAVLLVQHSDRISRGAGDRPGAAKALVEIWHEERRRNVHLRSVQDDFDLRDSASVANIGERNRADSARKSDATRDGKRRVAERGEPVSSIPPDGYLILREVEERGGMRRRMVKDPDRRAIYELHWELALAGHSAESIVLELARRGYVTAPYKAGHPPRPFDAYRVRQTLNNPVYACLVVHKGEIVGAGQWPAYVTPEEFHRLRAQRRERAHVDRRGPGRPPEGYALARIARCGECGAPMHTVTERHRRKDGSRARRYVCSTHRDQHRDAPSYCSARPIDAAIVDPALVDNLDLLLGDVDGLRSGIASARQVERDRLAGEVQRAQADVAECDRVAARAKAKADGCLAAGDDARADAALDLFTSRREDGRRAETRLAAARDALAALGYEDPEDEEAAFYGRLRAELAGRLDGARDDVKRLNAALVDFLERVELTAVPGGVLVMPVLSQSAAVRIRRDARKWPHEVAATVAGRPVEVIDPEAALLDGFANMLRRDPVAASALLEDMRDVKPDPARAAARSGELSLLLDVDEAQAQALRDGEYLRLEVHGPRAFVAHPGTGDGTADGPRGNPASPW